ncbi:armadillo-type protein [Mycena galopus ATCC 62051]|nr:armadillo-type protein [Mycena galopus ATCC 62051]
MAPRTTRPPTPQSEHSWWSDSNPTGPNIPLHAIAKPLIKLMYRWGGTPVPAVSSLTPRTTRPPTPQSAHSWWSDSNPTGPNISIHALAKPLMKLMHHRKALSIIKKNRSNPLSGTSMDIYSSYLAYKYLRSSTKTAILHDLDRRAVSEQDARAVVRSLGSEDVAELLESSNAPLRSAAWKFLGELAHHESAVEAVLRVYPCERIVAFLNSEDSNVFESAIYALSWITEWQEGAQAAVGAKILDRLTELLESPEVQVRRWTCKMVAEIAKHEYPAIAALAQNPCERLVSLLRDENPYVVESATFALSVITENEDAAQVVVEANILDQVNKLLDSQNHHTRRWTCKILAFLSSNKATVVLITEMKLYERLLSLLRDENIFVIETAIFALARMAEFQDGAEAAANEILLDRVVEVLDSPNHNARRWACKALGELVHHESTAPAILGLNPAVRLVFLLRDEDTYVIENAIFALSEMTHWRDGMHAVLDAKALECVLELLGSANFLTLKWTCWMLGRLTHNSPMVAAAILETDIPAKIVSMLQIRDQDKDILDSTIFAISGIIKHPDSLNPAVRNNMLIYVKELLDSPHADAQRWACRTLRQLAQHRHTAAAVLEVKPCVQLMTLLRDRDEEIVESAIYTLARLTEWLDGAQDAVNAKAQQCIPELLESSNNAVRKWTCKMLGNLAHHKSTAGAILELKVCGALVSLLGHPDLSIRAGVVFSLAEISEWPEGATAVASTKVLEHIPSLTNCCRRDVRFHTCIILRNLVRRRVPLHSACSWRIES